MIIENYEKLKQELEQELEKNNKRISENEEKNKMAEVNQLNYKIQITFVFSTISYVVLLTLCLGFKNIFLEIPTELITFGIIGTSLGIGETVRKILYKKYHLKERFLTFSKAKTEAQKLEEEIQYKIELEKILNQDSTIIAAIDTLDKHQHALNSLSNQYDINSKASFKTKQENKKKIEELSTMLKNMYQELDILTAQEVLHEKTWSVRDKMDNIAKTSLSSLAGAGFLTMFLGMTTIALQTNLPSFFTQIMVLASPIIGGAGTLVYMKKRKADTMKAFHNLNKKLNEFALSENTNGYLEENSRIKAKKENVMKKISFLHVQIAEEKRALESCETLEEQPKQALEPTMYQTFTYTTEEQIDEKGKTFILRRNITHC